MDLIGIMMCPMLGNSQNVTSVNVIFIICLFFVNFLVVAENIKYSENRSNKIAICFVKSF